MSLLNDFSEVRAAGSADEFMQRLLRIAHSFDFPLVTATVVSERQTVAGVGNVPNGFAESAQDLSAGRRDPVLRRLRSSTLPFTWDQTTYVESDAVDLWEEQAYWGFGTGVAAQVSITGGRRLLVGMDRTQRLPGCNEKLERLIADVQLLAVYARDAAERLFPAPARELPGSLTPRELDCLRWAAQGKSALETSMILGTSDHTVNAQLRTAMEKLEVNSKILAVAKALRLGYID